MTATLLVIVLLATVVVVGAGIFVTYRGFRSVDRPPVDVKPRHAKSNPHDAATTAQLKQFLEGKPCVACGRPIAVMHAGDIRPGLLNPKTHEATGWADIPAANLSATLESHVPICANCLVSETFRREYPDLVVDRHRTIENPSH
jgi:hypothetical protein